MEKNAKYIADVADWIYCEHDVPWYARLFVSKKWKYVCKACRKLMK